MINKIFIIKNIEIYNLRKPWNKHVNSLILKKIFIKLLWEIRKKMKTIILLLHQNNQFQPCTKMNGLTQKNYQLDMLDYQLALEKRQDLPAKIIGEFSEFINSRKLSNLLLLMR